ncbi:hypothetical protein GCM10009077_34050 [Roseibium denhamense]
MRPEGSEVLGQARIARKHLGRESPRKPCPRLDRPPYRPEKSDLSQGLSCPKQTRVRPTSTRPTARGRLARKQAAHPSRAVKWRKIRQANRPEMEKSVQAPARTLREGLPPRVRKLEPPAFGCQAEQRLHPAALIDRNLARVHLTRAVQLVRMRPHRRQRGSAVRQPLAGLQHHPARAHG